MHQLEKAVMRSARSVLIIWMHCSFWLRKMRKYFCSNGDLFPGIFFNISKLAHNCKWWWYPSNNFLTVYFFLLITFCILNWVVFVADNLPYHSLELRWVGCSSLLLLPGHYTGWDSQVCFKTDRYLLLILLYVVDILSR